MRKLTLISGVLAGSTLLAQTNNVAINNNGAAPNTYAILDVQSTGKGVLIPRMTDVQRNAIAAPAQGLTVYVTAPDAEEGFWYYEAGVWTRINPGSPWTLSGNATTVPGTGVGQNYLGTADAQPLVFRTNNIERARLLTTGEFGVGTTTPVEELDVNGAIMLSGTQASAVPVAGTIRYTTYSAVTPIAPFTAYSQTYHEGNLNGTNVGFTGWRKLENDYTEVKGMSYAASGSPVACNPAPASVALGTANGVDATSNITPFANNSATTHRVRHQYLFRPSELDVELNQLFNNPAATQGLCAGAQVASIGFNVIVNPGQKAWAGSVAIKHSSLNALTGAMDNTVDPAGRCVATVGLQPSAGVGWKTYTFPTPFVWDGIRGIVIEVSFAGGISAIANAQVQVTTNTGFNSTAYNHGAAGGTCNGTGACGNVPGLCTNNGVSVIRPVVQFNTNANGVSTAPPGTTSSGDFVNYHGALLVEGNLPWVLPTVLNWSAQSAPYYSFKGPGTIAAQQGIYDDAVRLTDHVFDRHFDGRVMSSDAAEHGTGRNLSIGEMTAHTRTKRHLPTMKGRADWEKSGGFALGDVTNQLWATTETQALYLIDLQERTEGLAVLSGTGPISPTQFEAAKQAVASMGTLTEAEKAVLLDGCKQRISTTTR
ncbi:MAG: hypothetical protein IPJ76_03785 [Flavobacteriales bacterium]|nr:MAG: hypothetical protein IPJ76_03785 [Flavobacteriales bacterium]